VNVPPDRYAAARSGARKFLWTMLFLLLALGVLYGLFVRYYNYSSGERAGWVQKFSKKGWLCKTWEGELALVTMPGTAQEKFYFTVLDENVAEQLNRAMGKRVSLHYVEKVGIPSTCFGETRHYVNEVRAVEDIPLAPGIVVPNRPAGAGDPPPAAPGTAVSPPASAPAQPESAPATPVPGTPSTSPPPSSEAPGAPAAGSTTTTAPAAGTPMAVPAPAPGESTATPGAPAPSAAAPTAAPAADGAANPAPPGTTTAR
jgi:hypothetical protein